MNVSYFARKISFYFYYGAHAYEHQLEGLRMAEPFFAPECYILIDDVNWAEPRRATFEFIASSARTYEVVLDRRTAHNGHPTFWNGIMLLHSKA